MKSKFAILAAATALVAVTSSAFAQEIEIGEIGFGATAPPATDVDIFLVDPTTGNHADTGDAVPAAQATGWIQCAYVPNSFTFTLTPSTIKNAKLVSSVGTVAAPAGNVHFDMLHTGYAGIEMLTNIDNMSTVANTGARIQLAVGGTALTAQTDTAQNVVKQKAIDASNLTHNASRLSADIIDYAWYTTGTTTLASTGVSSTQLTNVAKLKVSALCK